MKQQIAGTLMACIAVFTSGTTLAERSVTGIVKPLQSVQFSLDNDVKCLWSAVEAGDPTARSLDVDLEGAPRMRGSMAFPYCGRAADHH